MGRLLASLCLILGLGFSVAAEEIQGLIVDQNCVQDIVKNGRVQTLHQRPECSLRDRYVRPTYALVTDDKRYFTFDQDGNKKALQLLKGSPNRDDLRVVVTGTVDGNTIHVQYMSIL